MSKAKIDIAVDVSRFVASMERATKATRYLGWMLCRHRWQEGPQFWPPALRDLVVKP